MKSFFVPLAVVAALASTAFSQFTINTPLNIVVCQPSLLTWVGGTACYSILPANQPSAPSLVDLGQQSGTSVTWLANLGVGTSAFLNLRDSTGALAQSGTFTIQTGSNTTCTNQPLSISQGAAATPAPAPAPAGGNSSPSAAASSGGSPSTTPHNTASGTGSGAPKPTSGALSKFAGAGAAAFVGSAILSIVV